LDKISARLQPISDLLASLVLILALFFYGSIYVDFAGPPFEDAAMLMRYADHLAHGYGIVWNVGEAPLDGATDFLFMTSVAGLIKAGLPIGRSVRVLGLGADALTVLVVYWCNRKTWKSGILASLLTALYLAVGTGLWYVAAYFGTPFFALSVAITWWFGILLMQTDEPARWATWGFSIAGLISGLIRPEGVLIAALMLLSVVIFRGWHRSRWIVAVFVSVMLVLGGVYFVWHWSYFGHPLPNPYYKKGAGVLHWDSFWESLGYLLRFAGPFALAFILGLRSRKTAQQTAMFLVPLLLFAASFILVSNETNFGGRFQYALLPVVLMSYYPLVSGIRQESGFRWPVASNRLARWAWLLAGVAVAYCLLRYSASHACRLTAQQQTCGIAYEADGRYDVAQFLAQYRDKGYVMATTEAGLLPLYSGWKAVDAWGLNDAWIAQHGEITREYLDRYRPHLIVFHAYFSPLVPPGTTEKDLAHDWHRMTLILKGYAESNDYLLVAAFGDSPYESHYYYVRRDFPDSERMAAGILRLKSYYWYATGKKAVNYAALQR
jgi:arabinofuranosyltransferase